MSREVSHSTLQSRRVKLPPLSHDTGGETGHSIRRSDLPKLSVVGNANANANANVNGGHRDGAGAGAGAGGGAGGGIMTDDVTSENRPIPSYQPAAGIPVIGVEMDSRQSTTASSSVVTANSILATDTGPGSGSGSVPTNTAPSERKKAASRARGRKSTRQRSERRRSNRRFSGLEIRGKANEALTQDVLQPTTTMSVHESLLNFAPELRQVVPVPKITQYWDEYCEKNGRSKKLESREARAVLIKIIMRMHEDVCEEVEEVRKLEASAHDPVARAKLTLMKNNVAGIASIDGGEFDIDTMKPADVQDIMNLDDAKLNEALKNVGTRKLMAMRAKVKAKHQRAEMRRAGLVSPLYYTVSGELMRWVDPREQAIQRRMKREMKEADHERRKFHRNVEKERWRALKDAHKQQQEKEQDVDQRLMGEIQQQQQQQNNTVNVGVARRRDGAIPDMQRREELDGGHDSETEPAASGCIMM
jgi:hypothetical protein